ncbi:MAG: hypothetical protein Q9190_002856 [Brigantiaea leucoxantha]
MTSASDSIAIDRPLVATFPNHVENGREYHGYRRGMYMYPCDQAERERMDEMNQLFLVARRNALHKAPIVTADNEPPRILDLGCGTGIWCMDMAEKYEKYQAEVWGMDLANIQPQQIHPSIRLRVPRDYESPWNLGQESFNLIHLRLGNGSVSNWPEMYSNIYRSVAWSRGMIAHVCNLLTLDRHLKPGIGFFEQVEMDLEPRCDDGTLPANATIRHWYNSLAQATYLANRPIAYRHDTRQMLEAQGFTEIEEEVIRVPLSGWTKVPHEQAMSRWYSLALTEGLEAYSLGPLTREPCLWPREDVHRYCKEVEREILNIHNHTYNTMCVVAAPALRFRDTDKN